MFIIPTLCTVATLPGKKGFLDGKEQ